MTTTKILDHYRISVINDKNLFHLLSLIYKAGYANEINLKTTASLSSKDLSMALTTLYRANLIKNTIANKWSVTSVADELLSLLGIGDIVTKSLIEEQDLHQSDKAFLQTCISSSSENSYWSRNVSALLRASMIAFNLSSDVGAISAADKAKTLYALIVGTNPSAQNVDIRTYCNKIAYSVDSNDLIPYLYTKHDNVKDSIIRHCLSGFDNFKSSNHLLLTGEQSDNKASLIITLARFIANISVQRDTCDLNRIYLIDKNIYSRGWNALSQWYPKIESFIAQNLIEQNKLSFWETKESNHHNSLVRLLQLYTEQTQLPTGRSSDLIINIGSHDAYSAALNTIKSIRRDINNGFLDHISEDEQYNIASELSITAMEARDRFVLKTERNDIDSDNRSS